MKIIVTNLFATSLSLFIAKMLASAWFFIVFNYTWSSLLFFVSRDRADASPSAPKTLPEKCEKGISDKKKERWGMRSEEVNLELELKSRQMMMMILPWWTSFFYFFFNFVKFEPSMSCSLLFGRGQRAGHVNWWPTIALISLDISHVCLYARAPSRPAVTLNYFGFRCPTTTDQQAIPTYEIDDQL